MSVINEVNEGDIIDITCKTWHIIAWYIIAYHVPDGIGFRLQQREDFVTSLAFHKETWTVRKKIRIKIPQSLTMSENTEGLMIRP